MQSKGKGKGKKRGREEQSGEGAGARKDDVVVEKVRQVLFCLVLSCLFKKQPTKAPGAV